MKHIVKSPAKQSTELALNNQPSTHSLAQSLKSRLKNGLSNRSGNVGIMFGLMLVPIVTLIGGSVDFGRAMADRSKLQATLDSATLAAGREFQTAGTEQAALDKAAAYFESALPPGIDAEITLSDVDVDAKTVTMRARAAVPTTFLAVSGIYGIEITASSESMLAIEGSNRKIEVAMMLDHTGSMGGQKIVDLKAAANDLVDILIADADVGSDQTRVAIVPFAHSINAGEYFTAVTGLGGAQASADDVLKATAKTQVATKFGKFDLSFVQAAQASDDDEEDSEDGGSAWNGTTCVVERPGGDKFTDAAPTAGNWLLPWDIEKQTSNHGNLTGWWQVNCENFAKVVPLTSEKETLHSKINMLQPRGYTAGHLGTGWAQYMLSPNWAHIWPAESTPAAYNADDTTKVAVLMTDGEYNTYYRDENGNAGNQARAICEEMKGNGVTVYTVGFMLNNAGAIDVLADCASDSSNAFIADDGDELRAAFRDIGMRLQNLRLSK